MIHQLFLSSVQLEAVTVPSSLTKPPDNFTSLSQLQIDVINCKVGCSIEEQIISPSLRHTSKTSHILLDEDIPVKLPTSYWRNTNLLGLLLVFACDFQSRRKLNNGYGNVVKFPLSYFRLIACNCIMMLYCISALPRYTCF